MWLNLSKGNNICILQSKTLVDDLKYVIDNGYKIEKVKGMDMFPHTPHVECVVKIEKK